MLERPSFDKLRTNGFHKFNYHPTPFVLSLSKHLFGAPCPA